MVSVFSVMAVFIMSASLWFCLLGGFVFVSSKSDGLAHPSSPLVSGVSAHVGFLRSKRENQFLRLEEILEGNLERECYEERCSYEEAREYFENNEKALKFWTVYYDGDQCESLPCLNNGNCTDKVGGFQCSCPAPFHGTTCAHGALEELQGGPSSVPQITLPEMFECPSGGPEACHQLCTASNRAFICSCLSGFKLQSDGRSCQPEVKFPCGQLADAPTCRHGNCSWQVSLLNRRGVELCRGVVIGRRSVLTTARCLVQNSPPDLRPSNFYVVPGNKKLLLPVQAIHLHSRFHPQHQDSDLALLELGRPLPLDPALVHLCLAPKDFSENILMHPGRTGITDHRDQDQDLAYMTLDKCQRKMNISYSLSNKMFCMKSAKASQNQNRALGNQRGSQKLCEPLKNSKEPHEKQHENQNGTQARQNETLVNQTLAHPIPHGCLGNQTQVNGSLGDSSNTQNRGGSRLRGGVRPRARLLPGTPVSTEERGTSFLTGLLISSERDGGSGLVFIKLSRYLSWIKPRLEASEKVMTPQVSQYPESR